MSQENVQDPLINQASYEYGMDQIIFRSGASLKQTDLFHFSYPTSLLYFFGQSIEWSAFAGLFGLFYFNLIHTYIVVRRACQNEICYFIFRGKSLFIRILTQDELMEESNNNGDINGNSNVVDNNNPNR